mgnify:FL=1
MIVQMNWARCDYPDCPWEGPVREVYWHAVTDVDNHLVADHGLTVRPLKQPR